MIDDSAGRARGRLAGLARRGTRGRPGERLGQHGDRGTPDSGPGTPTAGFGTALALAMSVGPLATYGISATGPLVTESLDLSRTELGSIATVTFIAAALASALIGRAADVFSGRAVMAILFAGAGAALLTVAAAPSYAWLLVAVTASGVFQALSNPVTNQLISANVPAGRRGVLMGVKQSGVQMSQFGAGLALPSIALALGWRGATAVSSVVAVAGLVLVRTSVPAAVKTLREPGRRRAGGRLPSAVWWLCAYGFLTGAALQAMNVYLPLFGYERLEMSVTTSGLSAAVVGGVGLAARIFWGRVADRTRRPHSLLALLAAVSAGAALLLMAAALAGTAWTMWLAAVLFGASGIATNVVVMLAVVQVSELSVVGAASGVLAFGQYLGFAVGPVSLGAAVDGLGTYTSGWASVAAVYAAAAALALLWRGRDGPSAGAAHASTPPTPQAPCPGPDRHGPGPREQEGRAC
ncbi:MFS transporter [Actinomadura sp. SCN-SB]|uniref:MFS transporter n=1 Tax=Actinomadura sp. SCN-SB TaxID=3373092 RepID=UPI0037532D8C